MSICDTTLPVIKRTECIGNSLDVINSNFATLKTAACDNYSIIDSLQRDIGYLNTRINALTAQTPGFAKAWVTFDGTRDTNNVINTGSTDRKIISSYNIASVYRNSTANYTITFNTPFSNENYAVIGTSFEAKGSTSYGWLQPYDTAEGFLKIRVHSPAFPIADVVDPSRLSIVIY